MQFGPRDGSRAAFVTTGFQNARAGRELKTQARDIEMVEQMDKQECCAEEKDRRNFRAGSDQFRSSTLRVDDPGTILRDRTEKSRIGGPYARAEFALAHNGIEHMNE